MNIDWIRKLRKLVTYLVITLIGVACKPDLSDDPIRFQPFSPITVNINLPEYQKLRTTGFAYIDGGIRGIILYRKDQSTYVAYERNCSLNPNEACSTVDVHISNLYMLDPCCNSSFDFETGNPTGGPAWRPLAQYETLLSGNVITITDQVVNY